jgi:hypothetical protein
MTELGGIIARSAEDVERTSGSEVAQVYVYPEVASPVTTVA